MLAKPKNKNFSSGPCAKRAGWKMPNLQLLGRSHRSDAGVSRIQDVIELQKKVLGIPDNYKLAIVSSSASGAMETLLWTLLGCNAVDVLAPCLFGKHWAYDIISELKLSNTNVYESDFPCLNHIDKLNFDNDVVFCWTSTTSGVSVNDADWIPDDRRGLTICDATSAAFASNINWEKIDAAAFSWQKGLGAEAGFGSIVMSPRAFARLESYVPDRPIPKIFRLANNGIVNYQLFDGYTINTPSMLCVEEFYDNLVWADKIGGIGSLVDKVEKNYSVLQNWIERSNHFRFLCEEKYRAHSVGCIDIIDDAYISLSEDEKWKFLRNIAQYCAKNDIGYDFVGHAHTFPHFRIWLGPTIESDDVEKFLHCLDYAYKIVAKLE